MNFSASMEVPLGLIALQAARALFPDDFVPFRKWFHPIGRLTSGYVTPAMDVTLLYAESPTRMTVIAARCHQKGRRNPSPRQ
jgi:hypothetical protein